MRTRWNPLRSLTGVMRVVTWVFGLGAMVIVIANIAALGWLPGTDPGPTCVEASGLPRADAYQTGSGALVCVDDPTALQRMADIGDQVPQALFALGALYLLLRFLRTASREGPYAASVPGQLSAFGWFVLIGGPVSELLFALSRHSLRTSLVSGVPSSDWLTELRSTFPWWAVAGGVAALTFAYILRIGVRMNEDLEGTV